jgi:outer membrane protein
MMIGFAIGALTVAGLTQNPPPVQTPPPTPPPAGQQTPPPAGQKPATPSPVPARPVVPFPPDAKIAFINMQRLVDESRLGKQGQEAMKKTVDRLTSGIAAKNKEIETQEQKIKTQQNILAPAALNQMGRELERLQREAQALAENAQIEKNQLEQDLIQDFSQKVAPVVDAVRNEKGLWAIWVLTSESGIYAVHPGLDLTAEVLKRLDGGK